MDTNHAEPSETFTDLLADTYRDGAHFEKKLGVCKSYFRVLRTKRAGPKFIRIGRSVRYGEKAVADWLSAQQAPAGRRP